MIPFIKRSIGYFLVLALMIISARTVAANGTPIKIFLNYLPEFSNYGPTEANGVALVSIGEAWVELTVDGLPQLNGELYQAWLVTTDTEKMISLGTFNANAEGHVDYYIELDDLPVVDYRYFVISVEPDPDSKPEEADLRRSIAGVFPNPELQIISGTPTPTLQPGVTPTPGAPATLPVTGEPLPFFLGVLILGLGLGGLGGALLQLNRHIANSSEGE